MQDDQDDKCTGKRARPFGSAQETRLGPDPSGAVLRVIDKTLAPGEFTERHAHADYDEMIVVLRGACKLWLDGREKVMTARSSQKVARGVFHGLHTQGDAPCRFLVIKTPDGFDGRMVDSIAEMLGHSDDAEKPAGSDRPEKPDRPH